MVCGIYKRSRAHCKAPQGIHRPGISPFAGISTNVLSPKSLPHLWPGRGNAKLRWISLSITGPTGMPQQEPPPLPKDGIYRAILLALVITILGGAVVALSGDYYFHDEAVKKTGVGIVLVGGFIYFFFRVLGRREARKRENLAREVRKTDDGEGPSAPQ